MSSERVDESYKEASAEFEPKWRRYWLEQRTYAVPNPGEVGFDPTKRKLVVLDFFPYPSGAGLHIGHPRGYVATDAYVRFQRMRGAAVLYAMGFDSFGLPAEQYAIQTGQHPRVTTEQNVANILSQLQFLGLAHDPGRRFCTSDPSYYRWTQWIFLQLFGSYYDPEHRWTGSHGAEITGRARPIDELRQRLANHEWLLDGDGRPVPASQGGRRAASEEIPAALDRARLAYLDEIPVNWCPMLGTVLSNEEVTADGKSERGDYPVYKRSLRQWVLRITSYADRLLDDLALLDWPPGIARMQVDWIARSNGAEIVFTSRTQDDQVVTLPVYSTRPDTLMGATYMVLSPQHALVPALTLPARRADVERYQEQAAHGSTAASRGPAAQAKTGVFTGAHAIHPLTGALLPIWIADYVLAGYGSGAVMAVPAHDTRDFEFAAAHGLPMRAVVQPPADWLAAHAPNPGSELGRYIEDPAQFGEAFTGEGVAIQSAGDGFTLDELPTRDAIEKMIEVLEQRGAGKRRTSYRLRDWLFSRQRYWGEPFPIVLDEAGRAYPVESAELPIVLPELDDFSPSASQDPNSEPDMPLGRAGEWCAPRGVVLDDGSVRLVEGAEVGTKLMIEGQEREVRQLRRETSTMPNWAGSCWYYLRYFDAENAQAFVGREAEQYWALGPDPSARRAGAIDLYVGGAEHAVLHLLYARFWHKVLFDLGHVSTPEPFQKLVNQGMITADAYKDTRGVYVDVDEVELRDEGGTKVAYHRASGERLVIDPGKMGKRYKNGIPPERVCAQYSVDTFRLYQMYLGPLETSLPWQAEAIVGLHRFLAAVWRLATATEHTDDVDSEMDRIVHRTIQVVTDDLEKLRLNTAIAHLIEMSHALRRHAPVHRDHVRTLLLLLAPFAPHLAEELCSRLAPQEHRERGSVTRFDWPRFDPAKVATDTVEVVVQVSGRLRATLKVGVDISAADLEREARANPSIAKYLGGRQVRKVVTVLLPKPRLINFVLE